MKVVLAPDSFKESMTSKEACIAMEKGIKKVCKEVECVYVPMADGGEGTMDSLVDSTCGKKYTVQVTGPLLNKVDARFGLLGDNKTAVIEMAEASGLHLVEFHKRNPLKTTTYGTGELIKAALDMGVKKLIITLGGSATNDGGVGMLQALGASFKDINGQEISLGGEGLGHLNNIDLTKFDKRIYDVEIQVACDVKSPLTGETGASYIFGPQKGATKEMVSILDNNLKHFAKIVKKFLEKDVDKVEGAGAAGGMGAALVGFCNAKMKSGVDVVMQYAQLEEKLKNADFVFTGEGSIDSQTQFGKTPIGVSKLAKKHNIPVIAFTGKIGDNIDELYELGITSIVGIMPGVMELEEALVKGKKNLEVASENIMRIILNNKIR